MKDQKYLGSPHAIIWEYYECLKRQIYRVPNDEKNRTQKQELVLALLLSVSVIETFLNAFFRILVEEEGYRQHRNRLLKDFKRRISLDTKLREWPKNILGTGLDFNSPKVISFINLKNQRNALMHFTSSHESDESPGLVFVHGLADLTIFKTLSLPSARDYPGVIRHFSYEIFLARGINTERLPHAFHQWFGEPS